MYINAIKGTIFSVTEAIRLIPPIIMIPTKTIIINPIVVLALLPAQAIPATAATAATLVLVIAATLVLVMAATAATAATAVIHHLVVEQLLAQWMLKMVVTPMHPM